MEAMIQIRNATKKDVETIRQILKDVDEQTSSMSFNNFRVAENEGKIVGTVKLDEYDDFIFLSSLAVSPGMQKRGIAKEIMNHVLKDSTKAIYLYTVLPEFFLKFGFKVVEAPEKLPSKSKNECERCFPEKCVCMMRPKHDS
jgi:N-acetylglutamate synthase-like GNAT family acetyltransferase